MVVRVEEEVGGFVLGDGGGCGAQKQTVKFPLHASSIMMIHHTLLSVFFMI